MKRRKFLKEIGQGSALTMLPFATLPVNFSNNTLTFGIVADVHKDLTPDADQRLEKFIDEAKKRKVNFILQLGDFCMAYKKNKDFLSAWESFNGSKYHVLGNHDMDGHTKSQMLDFCRWPDMTFVANCVVFWKVLRIFSLSA